MATVRHHHILVISTYAEPYLELLEQAGLKNCTIQALENSSSQNHLLETANIVLGDPDALVSALPKLKRLEWVQSTWAGFTPLLAPDLRRDYMLTHIKDVFGPMMTEYVLCHMLMNERKSLARYASQQNGQWDTTDPGQIKGKTVGIMGPGSIGQHIARAAKYFGMATKGYSRHGAACDGVDQCYDNQYDLAEFVRDLDYLVAVLPDTPDTCNLVDERVLSAMKPEAVFINVGRGNVVDEDALAAAVNNGRPAGAVLDVFKEEPLHENHPFWHTPGIIVTSHTAALSFPEEITPVFIDNYHRFVQGTPLKYQVDFSRGY